MDLNDYRKQIDDIDRQLLALFGQRMEVAAAIAAYHSKARTSENVPVDYVPVRNVKKPAGAKPGMVIFTGNRTVWVNPALPQSLPQTSDQKASC